MRTSPIVRGLSVILLVAVATSAVAEEGGWSMPNLNPFAKKTPKKRASRTVTDDDGSDWSFPKLPTMPKPSVPKLGTTGKRKPRSSEPSPVTRMTQGTKNFFVKSYDVLTPWDNDEKKRSNSRPRSSSARMAKKDSWFDFSHKTDEEEIEVVNDFLNLPRPTP